MEKDTMQKIMALDRLGSKSKVSVKVWQTPEDEKRDAQGIAALVAKGWKVFRIWERDTMDPATLRGIMLRVVRAIDTPDVLEFGRALNMRSDSRALKHLNIATVTGHPLASAGGFHTRWHMLFREEK